MTMNLIYRNPAAFKSRAGEHHHEVDQVKRTQCEVAGKSGEHNGGRHRACVENAGTAKGWRGGVPLRAYAGERRQVAVNPADDMAKAVGDVHS